MSGYFDYLRSYLPGYSYSNTDSQEADVELEGIIIDNPVDDEASGKEDDEILIKRMGQLSLNELLDESDGPITIEMEDAALLEKGGYTLTPTIGIERDNRIKPTNVFETVPIATNYSEELKDFMRSLAASVEGSKVYIDRAVEEINKLKEYRFTKPAVAFGAAGIDIGAAALFEDEHKSKTVRNILKKLLVRLIRPGVAKMPLFARQALYASLVGGGYVLPFAIGGIFRRAGYEELGTNLGEHVYGIITGFVQKSAFTDVSGWSTRSRKAAQAEAADEDDSDEEGPSKPGPYLFSKEGESSPAFLFSKEKGIIPEGDKKAEAFCEKTFDGTLARLQDERGVPYPKVVTMMKAATVVTTIFAQLVASGSFFALTTLQALRKEAKRFLLEKPKVLHLGGHLLATGVTAMFFPLSVFQVVSGFSATILTVYVKKEMKDKLSHVPLFSNFTLPKIKGVKDLTKISKKLATLGKSLENKNLVELAKRLKEHVNNRTEQTKRLTKGVDSEKDEVKHKNKEQELADVNYVYNGLLGAIAKELTEIDELMRGQIFADLDELPEAVTKGLTDMAESLKRRRVDLRHAEYKERMNDLTEALMEKAVPPYQYMDALFKSMRDLDKKLETVEYGVPESIEELLNQIRGVRLFADFCGLSSVSKSVTDLSEFLEQERELLDLSTRLHALAESLINETMPSYQNMDAVQAQIAAFAKKFKKKGEGMPRVFQEASNHVKRLEFFADFHGLPERAKRMNNLTEFLEKRQWPESYELAELVKQVNAITESIKEKVVPSSEDVSATMDRLAKLFETLEKDGQFIPEAVSELAFHMKRLQPLAQVTHDLPEHARHLEAVLEHLKGGDQGSKIKKIAIVSGSAILAGVMNTAAPGSSPAQVSTEIFTGSLKPAMSYIKPGLRYVVLPIMVAGGYVIEHIIPIPVGTIMGGVMANVAVTDITTWMNVKDKKKKKDASDGEKKVEEKVEEEFEVFEKPSHLSSEDVINLRSAIFEGVKLVTENPWEKAIGLNNFIKEKFNDVPTEVLTRSELDTLHALLKSTLLPQITDELKELVAISISPDAMNANEPDIDLGMLGEKGESLVAKWSNEFSDFGAAISNYGRGPFEGLNMFVNGEPLLLADAFAKEFPHIASFVSVQEFALKTAFICEALFEKAKVVAPMIDEANLRKAVAETLLVGAGENNPISRHSHLLRSFLQFDPENKETYAMQARSNIEYRILFTTGRLSNIFVAKQQVSQSSRLVDQNDPEKEYKAYRYTSELTKVFKDFSAPWTGTLAKS
jgi:hypothetical protein